MVWVQVSNKDQMEVLALLESSGSQLGANLPPGDVWQCLETFLIVKTRENPVLLVSIR